MLFIVEERAWDAKIENKNQKHAATNSTHSRALSSRQIRTKSYNFNYRTFFNEILIFFHPHRDFYGLRSNKASNSLTL